jgi:hypothetical protein
MSVSKSATAKWCCLREFENELSGKSNQVLATEYSGYLLVYIGKCYDSSTDTPRSKLDSFLSFSSFICIFFPLVSLFVSYVVSLPFHIHESVSSYDVYAATLLRIYTGS